MTGQGNHTYTSTDSEGVPSFIQHPLIPLVIKVVGIYSAPTSGFSTIQQYIYSNIWTRWYTAYNYQRRLEHEINITTLGKLKLLQNYIKQHYNMDQHITVLTINNLSTLDLCISYRNITHSTICNYWSDHQQWPLWGWKSPDNSTWYMHTQYVIIMHKCIYTFLYNAVTVMIDMYINCYMKLFVIIPQRANEYRSSGPIVIYIRHQLFVSNF